MTKYIDVKPQWMHLKTKGTPSSPNSLIVATTPIPYIRNSAVPGVSVIEVLRVVYCVNHFTGSPAPGFLNLALTTKNIDGVGVSTTSYASQAATYGLAGNVTYYFPTSVATQTETKMLMQEVDFTDGNGNGVIVATDQLNLAASVFGQVPASLTFSAQVLYRVIDVQLNEFIGIVQSQF